jgi:hypothetical protein
VVTAGDRTTEKFGEYGGELGRGRTERGFGLGMQRGVEVDPPGASVGGEPAGQGIGEIVDAEDRALG